MIPELTSSQYNWKGKQKGQGADETPQFSNSNFLFHWKKEKTIILLDLDIFVNWFCPFSDAFFDSATGMPATSAQKAAAVLMSEQENNLNNLQNSPDKQADVPQNAAATTNRRLTQEGLKYEKIKKCTGMI